MSDRGKAVRVLLFSKYPRRGASSRLRFLQFIPGLSEAGIEVDEAPFFSDQYLSAKYLGKKPSLRDVLGAYARRLAWLWRSARYDVIWLEAELFPFLPALAERVLARLGCPIIVDYDDAIFHRYDLSGNFLIRTLMGRKIAAVMKSATVVTAGNSYLGDYARNAGAKKVVQLPTVVDDSRYFRASKADGQLVIGWVGTPITSMYVRELAPALNRVCRETGAKLCLVGADKGILSLFEGSSAEVFNWSEESEAKVIASFDLGIMPLKSSPWEQGKCGYKLIQYMAASTAVIATDTEANAAIIEYGQCGRIVAATEGELDQDAWFEAISDTLSDPARLDRLGKQGRAAVEAHYSLQAQLPILTALIKDISNKRGGSCVE